VAARAHFLSGQQYFDNGRYSEALHDFEEAYSLSQRAGFLYNIALCHERLAHDESALSAYQQFLREQPETADRSDIESRIRTLEARIAQRKVVVVVAPQPPPPRPARTRTRKWVWGVVGGAVAVVAAAVVAGVVVGTADSTRTLPPVQVHP
jgi:tetratricopeptide (TPR) repeat protein